MVCMVPLESAKVVSIAWKSNLAFLAMKETYPHPLPNLPLERGGKHALLSSSGEEHKDFPPSQGEGKGGGGVNGMSIQF